MDLAQIERVLNAVPRSLALGERKRRQIDILEGYLRIGEREGYDVEGLRERLRRLRAE